MLLENGSGLNEVRRFLLPFSSQKWESMGEKDGRWGRDGEAGVGMGMRCCKKQRDRGKR